MEIVSFEIAKKLKEKGFKEKCYAYYSPVNNELRYNIYQFRGGSLYDCLYSYNSFPKEVVGSDLIDAPTISQVLKWLRDEKKLHISIEYGYGEIQVWDFEIRLIGNYGRWWTDETYSSYELAAIAGIECVIDNNLI